MRWGSNLTPQILATIPSVSTLPERDEPETEQQEHTTDQHEQEQEHQEDEPDQQERERKKKRERWELEMWEGHNKMVAAIKAERALKARRSKD